MPDTTTDYSAVAHFLRMDYWPLEDAALLLLGLDPRYTHIPNDQDDGKLYWLDGRPPLDCLYADTPEMLRYILKRNDLLDLWENTDHDSGELKNDKARRPDVLVWAESKGITPPWKQWAVDQELWPAVSTDSGARPDVPQRERESLLNIIFALKEECLALGGKTKTQDWLIHELTEKPDRRRGVAPTKLREIFAEANEQNS